MRVFKTREAKYDEVDGFQTRDFIELSIPISKIYIISQSSCMFLIVRDNSLGYGYNHNLGRKTRKQYTLNLISKIITNPKFYFYRSWGRIKTEEEFERFLRKKILNEDYKYHGKLLQIIKV